MQARDLMTRDVVAVSPGTSARKIAKVLLDRRISAVPVVDSKGVVLGMVSEGDLLSHRNEQQDKDFQRSWWLTLLAEGEPLNPEFLSQLASTDLTAQELMTSPPITVDESAYDSEIAVLLTVDGIKRVPVLRNGRVVGIVSRADLIRAQAGLWKPPGRTHQAVSRDN
jgi:CBS domain-containing protein